MTPTWVARLLISDLSAAARLRTLRDVRAATENDHFWLCGPEGSDAGTLQQQLPEATFFEVLPDRQLRPTGHLVPTDRLPELVWRPLSELLPVELPVAKQAGRPQTLAVLRLVPSEDETSQNVLVVPFGLWASYAVTAPQARLDRWQFAMSADGHAVIRGEPLPPLPGRLFVEQSGIACPAGWSWSPTVDAAVLCEVLGSGPDDLVFLDQQQSSQQPSGGRVSSEADGPEVNGPGLPVRQTRPPGGSISIELIEARHFARATRSAVRASWEAVQHG